MRLRALLTDPEAFGSTYDREVGRSDEKWEVGARREAGGDTQFLAVAESEEEFVGMAGAYQPDDRPTNRELYGMWVAPEARSQGIGSRLVKMVRNWSVEAGAEAVSLWVVNENSLARTLYLNAGFLETGLTKPVHSNHSLLEIKMSLHLGVS